MNKIEGIIVNFYTRGSFNLYEMRLRMFTEAGKSWRKSVFKSGKKDELKSD